MRAQQFTFMACWHAGWRNVASLAPPAALCVCIQNMISRGGEGAGRQVGRQAGRKQMPLLTSAGVMSQASRCLTFVERR